MTDQPQQQTIVVQAPAEPGMWTVVDKFVDAMIEGQVSVALMVGSWLLIAAIWLLPKLWGRDK